MAIGRISGPMLYNNLERQGVDLAIDGNLIYAAVTTRAVGINNSSPQYPLDVPGNVKLSNIIILANTITSNTGKIGLGTLSNLVVTGGNPYDIVYTDGSGNLAFGNLSSLAGLETFTGNNIQLGANTAGALISNAVSLTTSTSVTNAVAQLNYVLGKLVPPSPPAFPNNTTISVGTTNSGLMCNFTQTDNSGWGNLSVAGGTLVSVVRASSFSTIGTAVTNVGPGSNGTITTYVNGVPNGNVTLTGSNGNTLNGNLYVYNVQDYHNIVSSVTAGFWYVFSTYATAGAGMSPGWNRVRIGDSGTGTYTNEATWYYDNAAPSVPAFTGTNMVLSSNVVQYSSTIPMFTTSAGFTLTGNVRNISGDTYPNSTNLISSSSANGAFAAPALVSYAAAGVTTPISRGNTALIAFTTTSNIVSGFGNVLASQGPSITVNNSYNSTAWAFTAPATYILYKTGTGTNIEETSIPVTSVGSGSGNGLRIVNPGSTDNPSYTGSEAAFNSTTGPLYTYDATNVGAKIQFDKTNYSTGFLPVGPDLSGQGNSQYFTFKFTRTTVSKFDILYSGTIAGLWVALPGSTIDTTASPTNGWLDMSTGYAGSGVPGTGSGGNGSAGCSTGGAAILNSAQTNKSVTSTFGTVQSGSSGSNTGTIYVRVKLTSGQSLTALSIVTATH